MYLFDKKDNRVDVYTFEPKKKLIEEYKRNEMSLLPEGIPVYKAVTNTNCNVLLQADSDKILYVNDIHWINKIFMYNQYHRIKCYKCFEQLKAAKTIEDFCTSIDDFETRIVSLPDGYLMYFLLMSPSYKNTFSLFEPQSVMDQIVRIPESLYVLHNMYLGKGKKLEFYDINDHVEFFEYSKHPVESLNLSKIKEFYKFEYVSNNLTDECLSDHQELIKKLNKVYCRK